VCAVCGNFLKGEKIMSKKNAPGKTVETITHDEAKVEAEFGRMMERMVR